MAARSPIQVPPRLIHLHLLTATWTTCGLCLSSKFPSHLDLSAYAMNRGKRFCEENLLMTLETCMQPFSDNTTYVVTGDIDAMWIRDSSAQLHPYVALAEREGNASRLRPLLEGALRSQAKFILTDPYANAFTRKWDSAKDERLARGAYVFTGNYELDDGPYFFRFLARIAQAFPEARVLREAPLRDAAKMLVALYRQEQRHANGSSEYLYPKWAPWELPGNGSGAPVGYTGMVWGAFRPSDDPQTYGYNVPGNIFLAATLADVARFAENLWGDARLASEARQLRAEIVQGVESFGVTQRKGGERVYCYEVDGLGNCLLMDDANVPSLLSLPYLDPAAETFDQEVYRSTRRFILSRENPWYFEGSAGRGIGSPHTGADRIWPLALVMQAMTAESQQESDEMIRTIMRTDVFTHGLTESFHKDEASEITRQWFGWPNALLGEYLLSRGKCSPSLQTAKFPVVRQPPRAGSLLNAPDFYSADLTRLRRPGVTLPKDEFY